MQLYPSSTPSRTVVEELEYTKQQRQANTPPESPPPPYVERDVSPSFAGNHYAFAPAGNLTPPSSLSNSTVLPCVIPQVTSSWRGAFSSPFVRAWPSAYEDRGIGQDKFIAFIDGLNEAWMGNPILKGTAAAGNIIGAFGGVHGELAIAGTAISTASGLSSAAISYLRTKAYFKACNEQVFHPAGLHAKCRTTKKMCAEIGISEEKLTLPARDRSYVSSQHDSSIGDRKSFKKSRHASRVRSYSSSSSSSSSDSDSPSRPALARERSERIHARRLEALSGHVLPLEYHVSENSNGENSNWFKRLGDRQAKKSAAKQEGKLDKKYHKSDKKAERVERRQARLERAIENLELERAEKREEFERELLACDSPKHARKIEKKYEKKTSEIEKEIAEVTKKGEKSISKSERKSDKATTKLDKKENKTANKVRWVVITEWNGDEREPVADEDDSEDAAA